ncbi:MAG: penicillin-binding protein [Rhodoferax sp.]|nr:penicillin-binding protein [Rhodoferax sp.]
MPSLLRSPPPSSAPRLSAGGVRLKTSALLLAAFACATAHALPSFDEVKRDFRPSDSLLLDRDGEVLQRLRTDTTARRGQWVPLAEVSPALRHAILLSEDKRFYEHSGVDWRAVSSAAWGNLWNRKTRGASTITMQLAGLLDSELHMGPNGRSMAQKIGQTLAARELEAHWRKDQMLEAYLNLVPLRGEIVGIDALSRSLFGKAAHGLDERESAIAAALVRGPNARPALIARRACEVLHVMQANAVATKAADCAGLDVFASAVVQQPRLSAGEGIAPHLARQLLKADSAEPDARPPLAVRTTLRAPLQRVAVDTLRQQLRELRGRHVQDGAVVVLDNASGEVLAWVGSSAELSAAPEVDGVLALRQPGSTLKPFLYAQAIAEHRVTAASLLEDSEAQIATASGLYIPQNYDRHFKGWVSVRTALASSLNVPAVRTLVMVSPDAFQRQLKAVGLPLKEGGDYYGYSLALGSAEVSLLSLTNAYRTLANAGQFGPTRMLPTGGKARADAAQAIDPRAAFIVGDILSDPNARALTFGADSILSTRFWTAVKTGTSKDMRDNWAIGWSQRYTVGVWVGNAAGAPMWDVSGTSGAAPIWAAVMQHLHRAMPSRAPVPPRGVVQQPVQFGAQLEAARQEWFIEGTQQPLFATDAGEAESGSSNGSGAATGTAPTAPAVSIAATAMAPPRITSPAPGSVIALDPDIPPQHQRLRFTADGPSPRWRLDGKPLPTGAEQRWLPWPGRHRLQLVDARGTTLDEIQFEVRGAGVAAGRAGEVRASR